MNHVSLKITGAQGQGVNSVGEMCAKGLKRGGYCVFGYREYMSLIKGGHSSYQLDISNGRVDSSETTVDILVCFNHHGMENNWNEVKPGGVILHQTPSWKFPPDQQKWLDEHDVSVVYMPNEEFLTELKAPPILGNVLITSVVWALLGRSVDALKEMVTEQFGHKGEKLLALNFSAIEKAVEWVKNSKVCDEWIGTLPEPDTQQWGDHMLITGSEAMGLGLVHGGCRMYVGYPMTPSSPLLSYISSIQNETGMVIKQAEDEITAAQMMSGAMHMGTRAATGTSGGGFDLMSETVSLNALIENPSVFVLAQRPGPATGLPTWTAQGDLLLAAHAAHGEFARLVMSVSDAQDAFDLMPEAFNYAEEFQTPVIVLTDKHIAEALWTQAPYNQEKAQLKRGLLITNSAELKKLSGSDRYDPNAKDGISKRWLPGSEADTYCAQGDEHSGDGTVDESAKNAVEQMEKRMKKMQKLKSVVPEPELFVIDHDKNLESRIQNLESVKKVETLIVSWGSNKGVILDVMKELGSDYAYLHYTYMWPLRTEKFEELASKAKKVILVECNHQGQLGMLLKQECGRDIDHKILKFDGRPFFRDELVTALSSLS